MSSALAGEFFTTEPPVKTFFKQLTEQLVYTSHSPGEAKVCRQVS